MMRIEKLKEMSNKIITDFRNLLHGKLTKEQARNSIGYIISSLKKYELEEGMYVQRSICVIPRCVPIIDLLLLYNMEGGPVRYTLTIRSEDKHAVVYDNSIISYNINAVYEDSFIDNRSIKFNFETVVDVQLVDPNAENFPSNVISTEYYVCDSRDVDCCLLNLNHIDDCKDCCINSTHYSIPVSHLQK